jgi:hypothetical protein
MSNRRGNTNNQGTATTTDTTTVKRKASDNAILIRWFTAEDSSGQKLDSSIKYLNRHPFASVWDTDLGNLAGPSQALFVQPDMDISNRLGLRANQASLYRPETIRYYNTTRPYTDLFYRFGSKQEQVIELTHTQNINPRLNAAITYRKEGSPGSYKLQRSNNDHLSVSSNYHSSNQRYRLMATVVYNKVQHDENGGIVSEDFLDDPAYNNRRLIPVTLDANLGETNRSTMTNYYRDLSVQLQHQYFIGKTSNTYNSDSTEIKTVFKPVFGIRHKLYTNATLYRFKDLTPDSVFYATIGLFSFGLTDSVYGRYQYNRIGNRFSIAGNLRIKDKVLEAESGYGIEVDQVNNENFQQTYLNNFLFASIRKQKQADKQEWLYDASLQFYLSGNLIGNTALHLTAGRQFGKKTGTLQGGLSQLIQTLPWISNSWQTNTYNLQAVSDKRQTITKLFGQYTLDAYRTRIAANYYVFGNYSYRDTTLRLQQYQSLLTLTQLDASNKIRIRSFWIENQIILQFAPDSGPLHVPKFAGISRIAYEKPLFGQKLRMTTGVEARYHSAFLTDQYSPLVYGFVTQYNRRIANFPRLSAFFNFRIKTFRASISIDEIQQSFYRNNINYTSYPGQNMMFRFGFHWMFVN